MQTVPKQNSRWHWDPHSLSTSCTPHPDTHRGLPVHSPQHKYKRGSAETQHLQGIPTVLAALAEPGGLGLKKGLQGFPSLCSKCRAPPDLPTVRRCPPGLARDGDGASR